MSPKERVGHIMKNCHVNIIGGGRHAQANILQGLLPCGRE